MDIYRRVWCAATTFTSSIRSDIILIDKVVDCKVAVNDHRYSQPLKAEFARVTAEIDYSTFVRGYRGPMLIAACRCNVVALRRVMLLLCCVQRL